MYIVFAASSLRREGRPRTPVKRPKSVGVSESIQRTPGSSAEFKLEVGMSVFCSNELGNSMKLHYLTATFSCVFRNA